MCHVFSCPFLLLGARATPRLRAPAPVCLSHPPAPFFCGVVFSSHPPAVASYDATAPTPHGLGPAAPLLVALSFGHSATFYYTTAVTTRAARWKQAGRPLQGTDHLYLSRPSAGRGVRSWRWMISRHGARSPARRAPCRRSRTT